MIFIDYLALYETSQNTPIRCESLVQIQISQSINTFWFAICLSKQKCLFLQYE